MPIAEETQEATLTTKTVVNTPPKSYFRVKRLFDIAASAMGLLFLSWLFLLIALVIKVTDGGKVFHVRLCVGKDKQVRMFKFRTMVEDADNLERWLTEEQIHAYKAECKLDNDPRITKIGRFLRKTSLDELPQLVSVLIGDMSLVGPRPFVEWEAAFYGDNLEEILSVKPGITGYWQVNGRSDATYESGQRKKLELYYIHNRSILLDLKILIQTFGVVFAGIGAK